MLSQRLLMIFGAIIAVLGMLAYLNDGGNYAIAIIPFVVIVAVIYTMSPQIDWWWANRYPPDLPPKLQELILSNNTFYNRLSSEEQLKFRQRVALYMMAKEYIPKGPEEVPPIAKACQAVSAVQVTFYKDNYLLDPYEQIVFYQHPFPSPQYPKQFHNAEHFKEDAVFLYNMDILVKSVMQPQQWFNVAIYETAIVLLTMISVDTINLPNDIWQRLERISGFDKTYVERCVGLSDLTIEAVAIHHFLSFPQQFEKELPKVYLTLQAILT